jgi:hypothetical protein
MQSTMEGVSDGNASRKRTSIIIGVALSVLIHITGLWLVIGRSPLVIKPPALGQERIVVSLASQPTEAPVQAKIPNPANSEPETSLQSSPPGAAAKRPAPRPKKSREPLIARNTTPATPPKTMPVEPQPDAPHREMSIQDDMFTQLEAARKRRADANAEGRSSQAGSSQEDESKRANSVALANIAESLKGLNGNRRDNSGGVFEVRHLGIRSAEFMFYGWNQNSRRNSMRLVTVEQGAEDDIQVAVVKKMIEIIREEKNDTFVWESRRLGRHLTLSAKPENSAELQQFLIQEFFPEYIPSTPTGANRFGRG